MIHKLWRSTHLALALLSSGVLLIATLTGIILALDAASDKFKPYKSDHFEELTLDKVIPTLREIYPEITKLSVDSNQFVLLEAFDEEGNEIKSYIDPKTGLLLGEPTPKSKFVLWNISLHRSLFLHNTGRFIVGVAALMLSLIAVSGVALIIKRQGMIRRFFYKFKKETSHQYFHAFLGRLMLLPILLISLTATYLFLIRFEIIPKKEPSEIVRQNSTDSSGFSIFQTTYLSEVREISFPFFDDPEDVYTLKLNNSELLIQSETGQLISEKKYPVTVLLERFSFDLHTGQMHLLWAILFGLACINILYFIYSGFTITLKRTRKGIKNPYKTDQAEYIILVGSENGSTYGFAEKIHLQLLSKNKKSFITDLNNYTVYPKAKQLLILTATYGLGEAPSDARNFEKLLTKINQPNPLLFSVVGFGSMAYDDFCKYARHVDQLLEAQPNFKRFLKLHTVEDKSVRDYTKWVEAWSKSSGIDLPTAPSFYTPKQPKLQQFEVVERAEFESDGQITFKLNLRSKSNQKFRSGDLFALYPNEDTTERLYSIGKVNKTLQLIVRLHHNGLGSGFLYHLQKGDRLKGHILSSKHFIFPKEAPQVVLMSNGVGIAPFLGMLEENYSKTPTYLYCGFRKESALTNAYKQTTDRLILEQKLQKVSFSYSRQEPSEYLMDLIHKDRDFFSDLLESKGVLMLCGSLAMQKDVEKTLELICEEKGKSIKDYIANNQIITDCY